MDSKSGCTYSGDDKFHYTCGVADKLGCTCSGDDKDDKSGRICSGDGKFGSTCSGDGIADTFHVKGLQLQLDHPYPNL